MDVTVKTPYAKVDRRVDRKFTGTTFVLGLFTYMTGWLWGWQYPENVVIMLPPRSEGVEGGWDEAPRAGGWDAPPAGWTAPPGAAAPEPAK